MRGERLPFSFSFVLYCAVLRLIRFVPHSIPSRHRSSQLHSSHAHLTIQRLGEINFRMSFLGYGSTGHNNSNKQDSEASSSSRAQADDNGGRGSLETNLISADGLAAGNNVSEKSPLAHYSQEQDHQQDKKDGHEHCFHGPGEHCSLPHMFHPLMTPTGHDAMESVVIKVRDSADVTQKAVFYFWDEWKLFVNRGNVIDLGIGVVIGGAFSDIIDSFVADILTPPLSLWASGTNLENSFIVLKRGRTPGRIYATYLEAQADGAVTENTGHFLKACLNFLIIAFCLFWIVKAVHNIRKEKIKPPPKEKTCNWCRESIALEAFRCKFCQSFVKDIPGIEDAGIGMFVTIKRPNHQASMSQSQAGLLDTASSTGDTTSTTGSGKRASTPAAKDGKKMATRTDGP